MSMTFNYEQKITLKTTTCYTCDMCFSMPESIYQRFLNYGETFYCPLGHGQVFSKPRIKKVEEELAQKQKELTEARCKIIHERNMRESVEKELHRHNTRTKNGVCPCCKRSFLNLQKHMKNKHPSFSKETTK